MNKQALAAIKSGVQDLLDGVRALLAADDPTPAPVPVPVPPPPSPAPAPVPAPAGVPAYVQSAVARRWFTAGAGLKPIDPRWDPDINPLYDSTGQTRPPWGMSNWNIEGIFAWSGGAVDPDGTTFYQWGGGHGDSGNNGIYALDLNLAVPTWRHERKPAGSIGNWDGVNQLGFDGKDLTSDVYYNGEPRSAHTYNGVVVAEGKIWCSQGYKAGAAGYGGRTLFWYDLSTRDWHSTPMIWDGILTQDMCYIPGRRKLYTVGKGNLMMAVFDIASGTWSQTTAETGTSSRTRLVYVPTHDVLVGISSVVDGGFFVHDLANQKVGGAEPKPGIVGGSLFDGMPDLSNGVWVPSLGAIVGWAYGANLWTLTPPATNPTTNAWTKGTLAADAGNAIVPVGRPGAQDPETFGRLFHWSAGGVDMIGLSLLEESINPSIKPYFFKL